MKKILLVISIITLFSSFIYSASACSCMRPGTPEEELKRADNVYTAKIKDVEIITEKRSFYNDIKKENKFYDKKVKKVSLEVMDTFKGGNKQGIVYTSLDGATCGVDFKNSKTWIIYDKEDNGRHRVSLCSRTRKLENAKEDLKVLKKVKVLKKKKVYNSREEFEKQEGKTCQSATDGCNTYFVVDGKIGAGTLMYCEDENGKEAKEEWFCLNRKEMKVKGIYKTREEFIKAEGETCETATDGVNTYFGKDFMASTLIGTPENFVPEWKCIKKKDKLVNLVGNDRDSHGCKASAGYSWSEKLNKCIRPWEKNFVLSKNDVNLFNHIKGNLPKRTLNKVDILFSKYTKKISKYSTSKQVKINNKIVKKLEKVISNLLMKYPQDSVLPNKVNNKYNALVYLKLKLQIFSNEINMNSGK
ncbi:hypothetical protein CSA08_02210 [Candidatus Gracilibacteria bacterium]|nr:MAG: hypothetical protein CSA08_02210 [Candidatus Gracilibacteria bacterium]